MLGRDSHVQFKIITQIILLSGKIDFARKLSTCFLQSGRDMNLKSLQKFIRICTNLFYWKTIQIRTLTAKIAKEVLKSAQFHAGFMTYLLVVVMGLVVIAMVDHPLFQQILDAISQLARAGRGG